MIFFTNHPETWPAGVDLWNTAVSYAMRFVDLGTALAVDYMNNLPL